MDLKQGMEILQTNRTFRAILATLLAVGNFLNGADVNPLDSIDLIRFNYHMTLSLANKNPLGS